MYKVFIDESGDLGNSFLKDDTNRGSYWFVLSAIIIEEHDVSNIETEIDSTKEKLKKSKYFHFADDKHPKRNVFINKIAQMNFRSIVVAQDKMELVNICKMAQKDKLNYQEIFEHVVTILFKEFLYMFRNETAPISLDLFFEENNKLDYNKIINIANNFSKNSSLNFKIYTCDKSCKCIQIADYLAGAILQALDEDKVDKQVDTSYVDKLIGKLYHCDPRPYPNIARMYMARLIEGPYKHRIKLLTSHVYGKLEYDKQGWTRDIQECF